jgi:hypothetical protein
MIEHWPWPGLIAAFANFASLFEATKLVAATVINRLADSSDGFLFKFNVINQTLTDSCQLLQSRVGVAERLIVGQGDDTRG